jgi:hypothetical protein
VVLRGLRHHKFLNQIDSTVLAVELGLGVLDVVKKQMTAVYFVDVGVGLGLAVKRLRILLESFAELVDCDVLVVLFKDVAFFACEVPGRGFSISEDHCVGE